MVIVMNRLNYRSFEDIISSIKENIEKQLATEYANNNITVEVLK